MLNTIIVTVLLATSSSEVTTKADTLLCEYFSLLPKRSVLICGEVVLEKEGVSFINGKVLSPIYDSVGVFMVDSIIKDRCIKVRTSNGTPVLFIHGYVPDIKNLEEFYRPEDIKDLKKTKKLLKRVIKELGYIL